MFRTTSLRSKLLIALGLPLAALLFVVSLRVGTALDRAALADEQVVEVDRVLSIKRIATAITSERKALTTDNDLDLSYFGAVEVTDQAFDDFLSDPGDTPRSIVDSIASSQVRLEEIREALPDSNDEWQAMMSDPRSSAAQQGGDLANAMVQLTAEINTLASYDPTHLVDAGVAQDLDTLAIADLVTSSYGPEIEVLNIVSGLPAEAVDGNLLVVISKRAVTSTSYETALLTTASDRWRIRATEILNSDAGKEMRGVRAQVENLNHGEPLGIDPAAFATATGQVTRGIDAIRGQIVVGVREDSTAAKDAAQREVALTVAAAVVVMFLLLGVVLALYRSIRRPITELTSRSRRIAEVELPAVVAQMRSKGSEGELPEITPLVSTTDDEIGELMEAFNEMSTTAVSLAGEQAASRRVVADMFVNLGRRNQKLLLRMLDRLEELESDERDADRLEQLFAVDHLATRMRRNAESLLVLAGARSARQFSEPVPIGDVIRSSLTEVEDYQRVELKLMHEATVAGAVVTDLSHLLAELVENALAFSPKGAAVELVAVETRNGYTIAVTDQGMGLSSAELATANERIAAAQNEEETPSKFLGLHVVGRLAARHGLQVELLEGIPTGVTARIRLPLSALGNGGGGANAPDSSQIAAATGGGIPAAPVATAIAAAASAPAVAAIASTPAIAQEPPVEADDAIEVAEVVEVAVAEAPAAEVAVAEAPDAEVAVAEQAAPPVAEAPVADAPSNDGPGLVGDPNSPLGLARRVPGTSSLASNRTDAVGTSPAGAPTPMPEPTAPAPAPQSVFGSVRREPGANMPNALAKKKPAEAGPETLNTALAPAPDDPRAIASSLGSFQSATQRADSERTNQSSDDGQSDNNQGGNQ